VGEAQEAVGERLAVAAALELLVRPRLPFGIDHVGRIALKL
jgi:hypothetical protein